MLLLVLVFSVDFAAQQLQAKRQQAANKSFCMVSYLNTKTIEGTRKVFDDFSGLQHAVQFHCSKHNW